MIAIILIIIGLPLGYFLFKVAIIDHYDFSIYITLKTYLLATIGTLNISLFLARKITKIDMVSSLKSNE